MATEATIKKKVYAQLTKEGYIGWSAPKVRYQETDIFGIFDGIFLKDSDLRFIQWTTRSNISARRKKIMHFYDTNDVFLPCEIWGWDAKKKLFKIEYI